MQYFSINISWERFFLTHQTCNNIHLKGVNYILTYILIVLIVDIWVPIFTYFYFRYQFTENIVLAEETDLVKF